MVKEVTRKCGRIMHEAYGSMDYRDLNVSSPHSCLNGTLPCVDFMGVTMGDIPKCHIISNSLYIFTHIGLPF